MPNDLDDDALASALAGTLGRPRRVLGTTASTNAEALRWAAAGAPEGALVVADHQSAGRGRWGRAWLSEPGASLLFSVVLRPELGLSRLGLLTTAAGVACAEGIEVATGLRAELKWPNDVMIGGRKVAGILVESVVTGSTLHAAVVGIGANVAALPAGAPAEVVERATTIAEQASHSADARVPGRAQLLGAVLACLESRYGELGAGRGGAVVAAAVERSSVLGRRVALRFADGRRAKGVAAGLAATGALEVDTAEGLRSFDGGEVEGLALQ